MDHRLKLVKFLIEQRDHRESVGTIFRTMLDTLIGDKSLGAPTEHTTRIMHGIKSLSVVHAAQEGLGKFVEAFGRIANKKTNENEKTKWVDIFGNKKQPGEVRPDSAIIEIGSDGKLKTTDVEVKGERASIGGNLSIPKLVQIDQEYLGFTPNTQITVGATGNRQTHIISGNPDSLTNAIHVARQHKKNQGSSQFQDAFGKIMKKRELINLDTDLRKGVMDIQLGPLSPSLSKFVLKSNSEQGERSIVYSVPSDIARTSAVNTGIMGTPSAAPSTRTVIIGARATPEAIISDIPKEQMSELTVHPDEIDLLKQYTDEETFNGIVGHLKNSNLISQ